VTRSGVLYYSRTMAILHGVLRPTEAIREMTDTLPMAEQTGADVAFGLAKSNVAFVLLHQAGDSRAYALELLAQVRDTALQDRFSRTAIPMVDTVVAQDLALQGDLDGAIALARAVVEEEIKSGGLIFVPTATNVLVEALLLRGTDRDVQEAHSAIDRMAAVQIEPGMVVYDVWTLKLRTQLAHAQGNGPTYTQYRDRYRKMATDLGFEGHMAWSEAMD